MRVLRVFTLANNDERLRVRPADGLRLRGAEERVRSRVVNTRRHSRQEVSRTDAKAIAEHPPEILLVSEYRAGSEFSYMPIPAELRPEYLAEIVENGRLSYKVLRAASYYCAEPQKCFLVQPVRPEDLVESRRTFLCSEIYHKDSLYPLPNVAFAKKTLAFVLRGDESAIAPEDIRTLYDSLCPDGNDRGCEERASIQEEELY